MECQSGFELDYAGSERNLERPMRSRHSELNRPTALAGQFLPPLAVLWLLLARNDNWLYLGAGSAVVVALVSLYSLGWRLSRNKRERGRLLRPTLALLMSVLALFYFTGERNLARARVNGLADSIQGQCQHFGKCPKSILGWELADDGLTSSLIEGDRVRHHYLYRTENGNFELRIDLAGNLDESAHGGAGKALKPIGAVPWR
jgi:hypothetical protein